MKNRKRRLLTCVVCGGLGLLVVIVVLRASTARVLASRSDDVPQGTVTSLALGVSGWQTLMLDNYDGTYDAAVTGIQRQVANTGSADYGWGRVITGSYGFTDTMWCVQGGQGGDLVAGADPYPNGVTTTLTYGPINLSGVVTTQLRFSYWVSAASGDGLEWGYSTDGVSFAFIALPTSTDGTWYTDTLDSETSSELADLPGERTVYLAFRFHSDDAEVDSGAFLNNVRLRVRRDARIYLPFVPNDLFVSYEDNFDDPNSGWPTWKKKTYNPDGTEAENHRGGYWTTGDGSMVFYEVVRDNGDEVFVTGPIQAPADFVYEAWGRYTYLEKRLWGSEYGILIAKDPIDPANAHTIRGYSFQVQINTSSDGGFAPSRFVLKKWTRVNWQGGATRLINYTEDDAHINHDMWIWNKFKLKRHGSTIKVYLNDHLVGEVTDNTFTGKMYIGFFSAHSQDGSFDIMWEFDNVSLRPHP